ncbi:polymer-forming protein [Herbinix hemicellulosilytica]|uniref:Polymer-forming protein n=1 Tax=Herbinix hemicellulosilytica TaxID=1564487 RepID=A0A0H5SIB5_HERHM|nr:polymer-forming cytoskeletal protein [Herbinix hemicellulosilytica]RBP60831.1 polymer-forming protein [Herbinix hemicellulosilytica]CRZ34526.1 hypothetical protein HHT355_1325 [Herbinix hemicellulosilytica]
MGFFKDFKDDLSKAVDELLPDSNENSDDLSEMVNTLDSDEPTNDESNDDMQALLDEIENDANDKSDYDPNSDTENEHKITGVNETNKNENKDVLEVGEGDMEENIDLELLDALNSEEDKKDDASLKENTAEEKVHAASVDDAKEDEVTVISKGTVISGNISSKGSLDIMGNVTGDVECLGKLTITGKVIGNATAAEIYVNTERMEGSINSEGSVKIGLGTVVIGDILGTSAVIAGAVKGDIDVNGPVVIDSTAIIKGNIKAKSLQINNGAVVDGFCSLTYSDVNLDNIFE